MFGDGSMSRDHTFVGDIVAGVHAALDRCAHPTSGGQARATYLQPRWQSSVSLKELIATVEQVTGKTAKISRCRCSPAMWSARGLI